MSSSNGQRKTYSEAKLAAKGHREREALTAFYDRTGWQPVEQKTPLSHLISGEPPEPGEEQETLSVTPEEEAIRVKTLRQFFDYLAEDGVEPEHVLRRVYAVGKAICRPPWSLLSLAEIAAFFALTRAAVSHHGKRTFSERLKRAGFRGFKAPYQKTEDAVQTYREKQRGNQNRRNGAAKKKPRSRKRADTRPSAPLHPD